MFHALVICRLGFVLWQGASEATLRPCEGTVLGLITRLAQHGLIYYDFNKFNLVVYIHVLSQFPGVDMHARIVILLKYI